MQPPEAAAPLYSQLAQAAKSQSGKEDRGFEAFNPTMPEGLDHEDLGLGKKQTSRVRGSRACPRAEPVTHASIILIIKPSSQHLFNITRPNKRSRLAD